MKITIVQPKAKGARNQVIRGRVVLPFDSRKSNDVMLVFAEAKSESARLAQEQGVDYIGAQELFEPLLNGEINPTKILATPSMLPSVTARLARFLGPKGLMPTTRRGGVGEGEELVALIREARGALDWTSSEDGVIEARKINVYDYTHFSHRTCELPNCQPRGQLSSTDRCGQGTIESRWKGSHQREFDFPSD